MNNTIDCDDVHIRNIIACIHNLTFAYHNQQWQRMPEEIQDLELAAKGLVEKTGRNITFHPKSSLQSILPKNTTNEKSDSV